MSGFFKREVNHIPHSYSETINSLDNLTTTFKGTYIKTRDKWSYSARVSEILEMIKYSYGIEDWDILDFRQINNGEMESWLMDYLINYRQDKKIDFGEVWEKIKKSIPLTVKELDLIETGAIDERLWAIFTVITKPDLDINYI